jgi:hypothetical protein
MPAEGIKFTIYPQLPIFPPLAVNPEDTVQNTAGNNRVKLLKYWL